MIGDTLITSFLVAACSNLLLRRLETLGRRPIVESHVSGNVIANALCDAFIYVYSRDSKGRRYTVVTV